MARSIAFFPTTWPRLWRLSMRPVASASRITRLWSFAFIVPFLRPLTYRPRRATPCESMPRRSARTRTSVVTRASSGGTPSFPSACSQKRRRGFSGTVNASAIPCAPSRNRRDLVRISLRFPGGVRSTPSAKFLSERLRCAFGRDRDDDPRQATHVRTQERLGPGSIDLPTLPEPRSDGTLHPELVVIQEFLQELERLVEFAPPDEPVEGVRRCASPPEVLRACPSNEVSKSRGLRIDHPGDRAGGQTVAQSPSRRLVDPVVRELP